MVGKWMAAYGVAGDEDQLGLAGAKALKGGLVTQDNLQIVSRSIKRRASNLSPSGSSDRINRARGRRGQSIDRN